MRPELDLTQIDTDLAGIRAGVAHADAPNNPWALQALAAAAELRALAVTAYDQGRADGMIALAQDLIEAKASYDAIERAGKDAFTAPGDEPRYLIWSHQHRMFWRPNGWGYTLHVPGAGRYTREDAERCASGPETFADGTPYEVVIPAPTVAEMADPELTELLQARIDEATRAKIAAREATPKAGE